MLNVISPGGLLVKQSSTNDTPWRQRRRCIGLVALVLLLLCPAQPYAEGTVCGTYRGTVLSVTDPLLQGRVQVVVPAVFGGELAVWAFPNAPFGRMRLPIVGAIVWVTFEACDTAFPIWTGTPTIHCKSGSNGAPRGCQTGP
jgi:Type VI secretion system/phage-baseplate injector OB domain